MKQRVLIEGQTPEQLLSLSDEEIEGLILNGRTLTFVAGTATVLGSFSLDGDSMVLELGHIDGGGEGVLRAIHLLATRYAKRRGVDRLNWRVHAANCAKPNPKLQRLLRRRGFMLSGEGSKAHFSLVEYV